MSNAIIEDLKKKLTKTEQEISTRLDLDKITDIDSEEEQTLRDEVRTLDRIHESLVEALRIAEAYDKVSNSLVDL